MYSFDQNVSRLNTGAAKWDNAHESIKENGYIPLSIADMEFQTAPAIIDALRKAVDHGIFGYTYADDEYFTALKQFIKRHHDWDVNREWLVTTQGVVQALRLCVEAFTDKGDSIIIQPPVYPPFKNVILSSGRQVVENPLICDEDGHYTMDFVDLEKKCAMLNVRMMFLCNPHNPVGRVWTEDELGRLARIAKTANVLVVSDEIHGELILPGNKHTTYGPIKAAGDEYVVCTAMSKTFNLAGMMCSNIFIPDKKLNVRFRKVASVQSSFGIPALSRAAAIAAFTDCDEWLEELVKYIDGNFEFMYDFIKTRLPKIKCTKTEGTYLAWLDVRALGLSNEDLEKMNIEKAGLELDEGYIFGTNGSGFERINLALPRKELERALLRWERAIRD